MPLKQEIPAIWDNMDETRKNYVKWNKPNKERQILICGILKKNFFLKKKKENK